MVKTTKKKKTNTGMVSNVRTIHDAKSNKKSKNLNKRMEDESRKQQNVFTRGRKKIHILFDGAGIKRGVIRMINKKEIPVNNLFCFYILDQNFCQHI